MKVEKPRIRWYRRNGIRVSAKTVKIAHAHAVHAKRFGYPATIVAAMGRSQWNGATDDLSYMRGVAERVEAMGGEKIAVCCARHFLEDMEMAELIERVE